MEAHGNAAPGLGVLNAVGDQVRKQALELAGIAIHIGVRAEFELEVNLLLVGPIPWMYERLTQIGLLGGMSTPATRGMIAPMLC